ncbi:hypothetical protein H257_15761 [Aphanomyces astaci]|uniref:Uncharacterized protein n=1 Tax=Aphanomyces astaci TaxID=112090 RepID=W4FMY2_APHAT|nr:hypothetical protein H257_15761 [Aphanomyces astaci]ETV68179.1 hypothetical protein H257_15761 [Aphanomyces astaci]|eukprot:XP_009842264.1 hypothetical protein H257_15761 [Aphanomyces astaci]
MKYTHGLIERIESKLTFTFPDKLPLVFDKRSFGSTHYVALFATIPSDDSIGYSQALLAFAPINEKDSLSATVHLAFASFVLEFHRFNFFVSDLLSNDDDVIQKVNISMLKQRKILPAARLRRIRPRQANTLNATPWISVSSMLTRYSDIKMFIGQMGDNDIDMLGLSPVELEECTPFDVQRNLSDIEDYLDVARRLGETADIVHYIGFESGVVKILRGNEEGMSATEVVDVQPLASNAANQVAAVQPILSLTNSRCRSNALFESSVGGSICGIYSL